MFTGIIQEIGRVADVHTGSRARALTLHAPRTARRLKLGSSVAIDGVCTTVEKIRKSEFDVRLMPVTVKLTTLGALKAGDRVNVEPSLRAGDELGGHFVMGHVDGVGTIMSLRGPRLQSGGEAISRFISIKSPPSLRRFIVPRGAIAVDGISLTIVERRGNVFTVSLVDYTLHHTTLGKKKLRDTLNIEIDPLARYAIRRRTGKI